MIEGGAAPRGTDERRMRQTDPLRLAGGARRVEHDADVVGGTGGDFVRQQVRMVAVVDAPHRHQLADVVDVRQRVVAHAARIVVEDVFEQRQLVPDLEQLVDLLLILDEDEAHLGVEQGEEHLVRHRVLVERYRHAAEALDGGHHHVHARPVVANDRQIVAAPQTHLGQTAGERVHFLGDIVPGPALPDTQVLLAHRRLAAAHTRMLDQQAREGVQRLPGSHLRHLVSSAAATAGTLTASPCRLSVSVDLVHFR